MTHPLRPWVLVASLFVCTEGFGQTMYRCGSKYQDRPCDAGQKGKVVGSTGVDSGSAPGAAPASGDAAMARARAQCAQLGQDALKIVWAREGGATQARLESEAKTQRERNLVRDVFQRRGSGPQVQAAVEADCVADKEKEVLAAQHEAAAARLRGQDAGASAGSLPSAPQPRQSSAADAEAARQQQAATAEREAAREAARKKRVCGSLATSLNSLTERERRGGSASAMDSMRAERRNLQDQMSSNGC